MEPEALAKIPLFADLDPSERARLAERGQELEVRVGKVLTQDGDLGARMFAILEGLAVVADRDRVLATLGPGEIFGEIGALGSGIRTANVVAVSDMRLASFLSWEIKPLLQEIPRLGERIERLISDRIAQW